MFKNMSEARPPTRSLVLCTHAHSSSRVLATLRPTSKACRQCCKSAHFSSLGGRSLSGWHVLACARAQPLGRAFFWRLSHCGAFVHPLNLSLSVLLLPPWPSIVVHGADAISVCLVHTSVFFPSPFATWLTMLSFLVATGFCSVCGPARGAHCL